MQIITQGGQTITTNSIEMWGNRIYCCPDSSPQNKILCGTYRDTDRTIQVFAEMGTLGMNEQDSVFKMPQN